MLVLSEERENRHDYCKYVAMVTEAGATFMEAQSQQNLGFGGDVTTADTSQKAALYKAARSHEDRAKTAKIQFYGWGATAGCYAAMVATGAKLNWKTGLKLGGSALLAYFFQKEVQSHNDAADKVKAIADQLPGRGDCNPVTDVDCYCTQKETMNDPKYCAPYLHNRNLAATTIRSTCVNKQLQADPRCACVNTDTCYNQEFMTITTGSGLPASTIQDSSRAVNELSTGGLTNGNVRSAGLGGLNLARKQMKRLEKELGGNDPKLTKPGQKIEARLASNMGIPGRIAARLASARVPSGAMAKARARFQGKTKVASYRPNKRGKKGNVWGFSKNRRRSGTKKSAYSNVGKKKKKRGPSGKVINFAEKAARRAQQINTDRDRPIFEIISRRYQLSGYSRLEIE